MSYNVTQIWIYVANPGRLGEEGARKRALPKLTEYTQGPTGGRAGVFRPVRVLH